MTTRQLVSFFVAFVIPAGAVAQAPPNVLIILADDLGVDFVGCYGEGASLPSTPNIDALAQGGVLFRNAWSNPLCSPTRATIQTGRYSFRTGIGATVFPDDPAGFTLQKDEFTLPRLLDAGTLGRFRHYPGRRGYDRDQDKTGDVAGPHEGQDRGFHPTADQCGVGNEQGDETHLRFAGPMWRGHDLALRKTPGAAYWAFC